MRNEKKRKDLYDPFKAKIRSFVCALSVEKITTKYDQLKQLNRPLIEALMESYRRKGSIGFTRTLLSLISSGQVYLQEIFTLPPALVARAAQS